MENKDGLLEDDERSVWECRVTKKKRLESIHALPRESVCLDNRDCPTSSREDLHSISIVSKRNV